MQSICKDTIIMNTKPISATVSTLSFTIRQTMDSPSESVTRPSLSVMRSPISAKTRSRKQSVNMWTTTSSDLTVSEAKLSPRERITLSDGSSRGSAKRNREKNCMTRSPNISVCPMTRSVSADSNPWCRTLIEKDMHIPLPST